MVHDASVSVYVMMHEKDENGPSADDTCSDTPIF
jgi:hypothetical protein